MVFPPLIFIIIIISLYLPPYNLLAQHPSSFLAPSRLSLTLILSPLFPFRSGCPDPSHCSIQTHLEPSDAYTSSLSSIIAVLNPALGKAEIFKIKHFLFVRLTPSLIAPEPLIFPPPLVCCCSALLSLLMKTVFLPTETIGLIDVYLIGATLRQHIVVFSSRPRSAGLPLLPSNRCRDLLPAYAVEVVGEIRSGKDVDDGDDERLFLNWSLPK
jgi:hypothetical protein